MRSILLRLLPWLWLAAAFMCSFFLIPGNAETNNKSQTPASNAYRILPQVGAQSEIVAMATSPDGTRLVTGEKSGRLSIYDTENGSLLKSYSPKLGGDGCVADNNIFFHSNEWIHTTNCKINTVNGQVLPHIDARPNAWDGVFYNIDDKEYAVIDNKSHMLRIYDHESRMVAELRITKEEGIHGITNINGKYLILFYDNIGIFDASNKRLTRLNSIVIRNILHPIAIHRLAGRSDVFLLLGERQFCMMDMSGSKISCGGLKRGEEGKNLLDNEGSIRLIAGDKYLIVIGGEGGRDIFFADTAENKIGLVIKVDRKDLFGSEFCALSAHVNSQAIYISEDSNIYRLNQDGRQNVTNFIKTYASKPRGIVSFNNPSLLLVSYMHNHRVFDLNYGFLDGANNHKKIERKDYVFLPEYEGASFESTIHDSIQHSGSRGYYARFSRDGKVLIIDDRAWLCKNYNLSECIRIPESASITEGFFTRDGNVLSTEKLEGGGQHYVYKPIGNRWDEQTSKISNIDLSRLDVDGLKVRQESGEIYYEMVSNEVSCERLDDSRVRITKGSAKVTVDVRKKGFLGALNFADASFRCYSDGKDVFVPTGGSVAIISSIETLPTVRQLIGHMADVIDVYANKTRIVTVGDDGLMKIWDRNALKEIASVAHDPNGEWVILTPEGYYKGSARGGQLLNLVVDNHVYKLDKFYDLFYRPDIVEAKLRGDDISGMIKLTFADVIKNPPPELSFTKKPATSRSDKEKVCYKVTSTGGGIGEVRLFQNGKLIKSDGFYREAAAPKADARLQLASIDGAAIYRGLRGLQRQDQTQTPIVSSDKGNEFEDCLEVETLPGENEISLAAFNVTNSVQSNLETIRFTSNRKAEEPHLYVLGVGIDQYRDPAIGLQYAAKDAKDFQALMRDKAAGLFKPENIHIQGLSDAAATKEGIRQAFQGLTGQIKPWDSFILFVASHGVLLENQYYIVTAGFDGTLAPASLISSNEIVGLSKEIKALSQLFIFDTCHAGGVDNIVSGLYDARMSVMAKKMGLHIYASAGSVQEALDGYKGNGLFTHTLLKGMQDGGTTDSNKDHQVSVIELGQRARQETSATSKTLGHPQTPYIINFGRDSPLFGVE